MRTRTIQGAALIVAVWAATIGWAGAASSEKAREGDEAGESIVVEPRIQPPRPPAPPQPPDYGFDVDLWTAKRVYEVGDLIRIYFRVTRPCYVYIFDTDTRGETHQLFPNYYDRDNRMVPGRTYYIPDRTYRLRVTGPPGTEHLRIVAVRDRATYYERRHPYADPRQPFPLYPEGAEGFLREYQRERGGAGERDDRGEREGRGEREPGESRSPRLTERIERAERVERAERAERVDESAETIVIEPGAQPRTIVVEPGYYDRDYAEAHTTVQVVDPYYAPPEPVFGKLDVTSRPSGARVMIDGVLRGYTPMTLTHIAPGPHDVSVSLPGYVSWSRTIDVPEGRTVRIEVRLRPYEPRGFFDFRWEW